MKAAVHTSYGPPEVVRVVDVPAPVPTDDQVLVKVHATTVNRTDCGFRAAKPWLVRPFSGLLRPRRTILGNEFAGEVTAVGRAVTSFAAGDRVFGYDDSAWGAHAEYLVIRQDASLARIPAELTYQEAAPATEGSHYALANIDKAGIRAGQRVLVNGATGAIGSAAVQLLASRGVHVTAVCGTAHVELVRRLGAERVIGRGREDFTRDTQTYDVVFDAVGKSSFGRCRHLLGPRGVYLSTELGPRGQNPFLALVTPLLPGRSVRFPLPRHDQAMINQLRDLMESGQFRPVVDRSYPLADIVEAYRYVETGQKIGNVVITMPHAG
ncbi:MAG TPA: NAD(P)-dependent alcohol dehydrogenase [Actinoplanes sp.]|nr:NAD(P)-dependent alcohol dehydrogenase [Actinoplanes sp.]